MMLEDAIRYAERGWHVLPLHTPHPEGCSCMRNDCSSIGKHPRVLHGVNDATTRRSDIEKWWRLWPEANVGIACGEVSGLVVLDCDPRNGGLDTIRDFNERYGEIGPPSVRTGGGGYHWYWRYPDPGIRKGVLGSGLDLQSDGSYVVAPPSVHQAGEYEWVDGWSFPALPGEMPEWVYEARRRASGGTGGFEIADDYTDIDAGARNNTLTSIAGSMRRKGLSQRAIVAALLIHNEEACTPPLPESEVKRIAWSVCRYEPGDAPSGNDTGGIVVEEPSV